ncbi:hypothetical protein K470DRAFT_209609 [Piedraia hortae CBS 480.64]|uniref:25S rRNA (uridine-N(3))-methyltransferase BMT5-like domain-containing protein n=1 Tax=Piedraia hortae CBS 480.64 TaxID=1314780 RepID=A0A6A7C996_9PEZI|nr:hypothetical protein K470DRAFT_209609 [Piedraia hortae CBS 480.64]
MGGKRKRTDPTSKGPARRNHGIRKKQKSVVQQSRPSPIKNPFEAESGILLFGEGDFSFARSLVDEHGCCDVTATSLDSQAEVQAKYAPQAEENTRHLIDEGQTVWYNVDATRVESDNRFFRKKKVKRFWDVVAFNFPHVGGKSKDVNRQVRFNQELLVGVFKAASPLLCSSGTIIITLFEGEPYTLWNIRDLARYCGLQVVTSFRFNHALYPGYSHARTLGNIEGSGGWKGEEREAKSYVFRNKTEDITARGQSKRGQED